MSYTELNGRAQFMKRENDRLTLARWVYHHPERFQLLVDKLKDQGVDLIGPDPMPDDPTFNIEILVQQLGELTTTDIDNITGVNLSGN